MNFSAGYVDDKTRWIYWGEKRSIVEEWIISTKKVFYKLFQEVAEEYWKEC